MNYIRYTRQSAGALNAVVRYVEQEKKTLLESGEQLVGGINCSPDFANGEFLALRQLYGKTSPHWFYHYTRSFHPEEKLDGVSAHCLAMEFAEQAWPGCQVLVATHIDARHIHSHFLVNAVRFDDGKMLRIHKGTLGQLRHLSDELCEKHGLSILPKDSPRHGKGLDTREYRSAEKGQSWKMQLVVAIEDCMRVARSREHFLRLMRRRGYQVRWDENRKSITYTTPMGMKCRDLKLHEDKFLKHHMEVEFEYRRQILKRIEANCPDTDATGGPGRALRDGNREELAGASQAARSAAADAGAASGGSAGAGDLGGASGLPGRTESLDGEIQTGDGRVPVGHEAGRRGDGEDIILTGWGAERELFELSLLNEGSDEALAPEAVLDQPDPQLDPAALGIDAAYLAADLSGVIDHGPVRDSTTVRHRRKKQKKAPGQQDQEREERYEQTM